MNKEILLTEISNVKKLQKELSYNSVHSFDVAFTNLYNNVLMEYYGENEDSKFYHVRKLIERMGKFGSISDRHKEGEFLEIKGASLYAIGDLQKIVNEMK